MEQYIWYSPQYDILVLQTYMKECTIHFEWGLEQGIMFVELFGYGVNFMEQTTWFPIGML